MDTNQASGGKWECPYCERPKSLHETYQRVWWRNKFFAVAVCEYCERAWTELITKEEYKLLKANGTEAL